MIFEATWAFLLLISASLAADAAAKNDNNTYSVRKSYYGQKRQKGQSLDTLITAVVSQTDQLFFKTRFISDSVLANATVLYFVSSGKFSLVERLID